MSPLSKDIKKNALPAAAALLFFCGAFLNGCGSDGKASRPVEAYEGGTASVALEISGEEPPGIDSLVITAEGPDSLRITKTALGETAEFSLRPAETWKITAKLYANGLLAEKGELELSKVQAGETRTATIELKAVTGYLYVQIPLGLGNPAGVRSGTLLISGGGKSDETDTLVIGDAYATFTSKALGFGTAYRIRMAIFGSGADTLYTFDSTLTLTRDNPFPALELRSLRGNASVTFKMDAILPAKSISANIFSGRSRTPKKGDILITEIMIKPGISPADSFKFLEIYNGTLDTLLLDSCTIAESSKIEKNYWNAETRLAPTTFAILGTDSVRGSGNYTYIPTKLFSFPATKKSIVLHCRGTVIDSLYYYTKGSTDSTHTEPFENIEGATIQLPLKNYKGKASGIAWCAGSDAFTLQNQTFYGTPGADAVCE